MNVRPDPYALYLTPAPYAQLRKSDPLLTAHHPTQRVGIFSLSVRRVGEVLQKEARRDDRWGRRGYRSLGGWQLCPIVLGSGNPELLSNHGAEHHGKFPVARNRCLPTSLEVLPDIVPLAVALENAALLSQLPDERLAFHAEAARRRRLRVCRMLLITRW